MDGTHNMSKKTSMEHRNKKKCKVLPLGEILHVYRWLKQNQ
jgi:hypothetical protein